ncbi:MAG: hypothetical protein K0V04_24960 [Deltaproteobacteria bacterium]|nr:hypothetical protein [Deltaproteobacteria bacterium]
MITNRFRQATAFLATVLDPPLHWAGIALQQRPPPGSRPPRGEFPEKATTTTSPPAMPCGVEARGTPRARRRADRGARALSSPTKRRELWLTPVVLAACFDPGITLPDHTNTPPEDTTTGATTTGATAASGTTLGSTGADTGGTTALPDSSSGDEAPTAIDDEYAWLQGPASLGVDTAEGLLANDAPADGIILVSSDVRSARGGFISTEPGGGFVYEAPEGFWGVDSFGYTIEDEGGMQSTGSVTIHVRPVLAPISELTVHEAGLTILGKSAAELPAAVESRLGGDLRSLGDWDGDGIDDLGIVANHTRLYDESEAASDNEGPIYVVLGGEYDGDLDLSDLDNNQGGFAVQGGNTSNSDPATVVGGDFNGDGQRDLATTAPFQDLSGAAYLVYGDQRTQSFSLAAWDFEHQGFIINQFSRLFAGIGDMTGDGRDELAFSGCGVILGADQIASYGGNTPPMRGGFSLSGFSVCHAQRLGDVDGDGLPELLMYVYDTPGSAFAYVMWSQPTPADTTFDAMIAAGDGYYIFDSGLGNFYGDWRWASGGGDVDGDGRGDILINAENILAVAYGKATTGQQNAVDFYGGVGGFRINTNGVTGGAARIVGDVNGDGLADILIVRQDLDQAYVLYGGPAAQRDLPEADGDGLGGFVIDGIGLGVRMRTTSGDWNGDGLADVAFGAQDSLGNRGAVHVVYGVRTQLSSHGSEAARRRVSPRTMPPRVSGDR